MFPIRTCKCGNSHECWALDPRENGKRRWKQEPVGEGLEPPWAPEERRKLQEEFRNRMERKLGTSDCMKHRTPDPSCPYCVR